MQRIIIAVAVVVALGGGYLVWQPADSNPSVGKSEANYLLAFHGCDTAKTDCRKPQNHLVYVAESQDGEAWNLLPNWEPFAGSVPDIVEREGILYIYSAQGGGTVVRYDLSLNKILSQKQVSVENVVGFVDPAPIIDEDGNIVLFFLHCRYQGSSTHCFDSDAGTQRNIEPEHFIGSAVEVEGSDGAEFVLVGGDRLTTKNGTDPDIFFDGSRYVLYVSYGPSVGAYSSLTLHGSYISTLPSRGFLSKAGGVPSGYYDAAVKLYQSFVHAASGADNIAVIKTVAHQDLSSEIKNASWKTILTAEELGLAATTTIESPGILVLE